ncbi:MAG: LysM peptidoglycan-binding domain-containing protein [Rhodospirillales bacterium]|nr:LysM peptidoglycan-binding domain-containing protein [Rhodospirillales bacterium]
MKRPYILVIVGVVLIIAAIVANYMLTKSADEETAPAAMQPPAVSTTEMSEVQTTESETASETAAPAITNPSFDVVRIGPDGNAVIAGRAEPNSKVVIREGDEVIGEATADERGEWVVLPGKPLASGDRELSLESEDKTGKVSKADDKVVVLIPDTKPVAATTETTVSDAQTPVEPEEEKQPIIALKVPSKGDGAATVLQGPAVVEQPSAEVAKAGTQEGGEASEAPAKMPRLSIDIVDYDTEGRVAMSGKADLDHTIRVYLDNNHVGTAPSDASGNWALTIGEPIEPGNYTMRADQSDALDKVTARVEIPFERAKPEDILEPGSRYVVQPGNSLWRIARRTYGDGLKYWVIYNQNSKKIRDPDLIYPGQIFALPSEEKAQ